MAKDMVHFERPTLGPFMSVVCFRYLHDDAMDLAGRALIVDAGRQRGQDLMQEIDLANHPEKATADALLAELDKALGLDGTRLCLVQSVKATDNGGFEIHSKECASALYTLGVLIGSISAIAGKTMVGQITEAEPTTGSRFVIEPL